MEGWQLQEAVPGKEVQVPGVHHSARDSGLALSPHILGYPSSWAATVQMRLSGSSAFRSSSRRSYWAKSASSSSFCVQSLTLKKLAASSFWTFVLKPLQETNRPSCAPNLETAPSSLSTVGLSIGLDSDLTSTHRRGEPKPNGPAPARMSTP